MSLPASWAASPHQPVHDGPHCGHRNPRNGHHCTRPVGHDGGHAWTWQRLPTLHGALAGRVRDTWEDQ